jgi:hypothetical protein
VLVDAAADVTIMMALGLHKQHSQKRVFSDAKKYPFFEDLFFRSAFFSAPAPFPGLF